jgi:hypothetical protein
MGNTTVKHACTHTHTPTQAHKYGYIAWFVITVKSEAFTFIVVPKYGEEQVKQELKGQNCYIFLHFLIIYRRIYEYIYIYIVYIYI